MPSSVSSVSLSQTLPLSPSPIPVDEGLRWRGVGDQRGKWNERATERTHGVKPEGGVHVCSPRNPSTSDVTTTSKVWQRRVYKLSCDIWFFPPAFPQALPAKAVRPPFSKTGQHIGRHVSPEMPPSRRDTNRKNTKRKRTLNRSSTCAAALTQCAPFRETELG